MGKGSLVARDLVQAQGWQVLAIILNIVDNLLDPFPHNFCIKCQSVVDSREVEESERQAVIHLIDDEI